MFLPHRNPLIRRRPSDLFLDFVKLCNALYCFACNGGALGNDGRPKSWYFDVSQDTYEAEHNFLKAEIYQADINLPVTKITAKDRFSNRV